MRPPPTARVTESLHSESLLRRAIRRRALRRHAIRRRATRRHPITTGAPRGLPYRTIRNSSLAPRPLLPLNTGHAPAISARS